MEGIFSFYPCDFTHFCFRKSLFLIRNKSFWDPNHCHSEFWPA